MSAVTLESAQADLDKAKAAVEAAAATIEKLKALSRPTVLKIAGVEIALQPGERYAGPVLDTDGNVKHYLVLMAAKPEKRMGWQTAMNWAASVGGVLPDRQEQALLYANCKPHLEPVWHWSSVTHESDASSAWGCSFTYGYQGYSHQSYEGAAVAVRRLDA